MEEFLKRIDWALLRKQKSWLIERNASREAQGLINFLDSFQDMAVDKHGIGEKTVFNLEEDDEQTS